MKILGVVWSLLLWSPNLWADQISFYQTSDGMELERFSNGTVDESKELKNLNDNHPTCPCASLHLPDTTPFRNTDGKRWKAQGTTVVEVDDMRADPLAKRQKRQAAVTKLQAMGLTPQDLKDALGQ